MALKSKDIKTALEIYWHNVSGNAPELTDTQKILYLETVLGALELAQLVHNEAFWAEHTKQPEQDVNPKVYFISEVGWDKGVQHIKKLLQER